MKTKNEMIIFVGLNPSALNDDPNIAFVGSKSYPILLNWIKQLEISDYEMINISSKVGKVLKADIDYKNLKIKTDNKIVVALGNVSSKALSKLDVVHFKLPHPSPKNRQLNDESFIVKRLAECKVWLSKY